MSSPIPNISTDEQSPLIKAYDALISSGELHDDPGQRDILLALDDIRAQLSQGKNSSPGFLKSLFTPTPGHEAPTGLYIWGHVGRGKSMLMDLFYQHTRGVAKKRIHFHEFMQRVHNRIHELRQTDIQNHGGADPVITLAKEMADEIKLLCFDELQVHDVADATLLYRLFDGLWNHGVTVISTSNRPPESLYTGEIQKERFDNFINLIKENMAVATIDSQTDYRTTKIQDTNQRYYVPLGMAADQFIHECIETLCKVPTPQREILEVKGRQLRFSLYDNHIGRFSFADLCEKPLGAVDYLALAKRCDTIILTGIPLLSPEKRNEAKRFVTLIDTLYEHKTIVYFTATAEADRLYPEGHGAFEFKRTVSRLLEMQSKGWGNI